MCIRDSLTSYRYQPYLASLLCFCFVFSEYSLFVAIRINSGIPCTALAFAFATAPFKAKMCIRDRGKEETNTVAEKSDCHSLRNCLTEKIVVVSSVKYFYRTGMKSRRQCQKCRESGKGNGGKGLFRRSAKFRNERSVKIHSCKEEWVKDKNSWNTQEIIWHIRASDQKSGGNGYQHIMRNPFDIRRNYAPDKERHNVPKRKLRTQQIQAGIFVKKAGIHKIVKKFIDYVRYSKLTNQCSK